MKGNLRRPLSLLLILTIFSPLLQKSAEADDDIFPVKKDPNIRIVVNQVGYLANGPKNALLVNIEHIAAMKAELVEAESKRVVLVIDPGPAIEDPHTGNVVRSIDFNRFHGKGQFFLRYGEIESYAFSISENVFDQPAKLLLRSFYLQRCGAELSDSLTGIFHTICHEKDGFVAHEDSLNKVNAVINAAGGWHDAGDYGKYTATTTVTIARLLSLYEHAPEFFTDGHLDIPESGNSLPDLLDEMRVGLEWLLRMQRGDGAVYRKLSGKSWPHQLRPEKDFQKRYLYGITTPETAKFAAVAAMAARIYQYHDAEFADKCLKAAEAAWGFLQKTDKMVVRFYEGDDSGSGPYLYSETDNEKALTVDSDDRLWAATELYLSTRGEAYYRYFKKHYNDFDITLFEWKDPSSMALTNFWLRHRLSDNKIARKIEKKILDRAGEIMQRVNSSGYRLGNHRFIWGSNKMVAEEGITLFYAYMITRKMPFFSAALDQINYLFGQNAFDLSFVSGVGSNPVKNVSHLFGEVAKLQIPGLLVGGPNILAQDGLAPKNQAALSYTDHVRAYSVNEYAIDYNASLITLLGLVMNESIKRMGI